MSWPRCRLARDDRRDGVIGLAFAMRRIAQLLLMCDRQDIGVSIGNGMRSTMARCRAARRRGRPGGRTGTGEARRGLRRAAVFVYDNYPGGIGLSASRSFTMRAALLAKTRDLILDVPVRVGVPVVRGAARRGRPLAKTVALDILRRFSLRIHSNPWTGPRSPQLHTGTEDPEAAGPPDTVGQASVLAVLSPRASRRACRDSVSIPSLRIRRFRQRCAAAESSARVLEVLGATLLERSPARASSSTGTIPGTPPRPARTGLL